MSKIHKVAVLVGSLRKASINRKLALALAELAPPSLQLQLVEIGDLPLYDEDIDVSHFEGVVFDPEEPAPAAVDEPAERLCEASFGDGQPCTHKAKDGSRYCGVHAKLADSDGLCRAFRVDGTPCPNKSKDGIYCGVHAKLEAQGPQ